MTVRAKLHLQIFDGSPALLGAMRSFMNRGIIREVTSAPDDLRRSTDVTIAAVGTIHEVSQLLRALDDAS